MIKKQTNINNNTAIEFCSLLGVDLKLAESKHVTGWSRQMSTYVQTIVG